MGAAPASSVPDGTLARLLTAVEYTGSALTSSTTAGNVLTNDSDPDGDSLAVSAVAGLSGNAGAPLTGADPSTKR